MAEKKSPHQVRAEAEAAEYTTWKAKVDIWHDGVVAYRPGHAVPVSNVAQYKYDEQDLVERVRGEEKAQASAAVPGTSTTADQA
jgi:hypothetical protein